MSEAALRTRISGLAPAAGALAAIGAAVMLAVSIGAAQDNSAQPAAPRPVAL
jgi:Flp pilus assembly protein CpaB